MKTLIDFINESLEREKGSFDDYEIITLVKREDLDCKNLTEEDFVKYICQDVKTAAKIYSEETDKINIKKAEERLEKRKEEIMKDASIYYKREGNRKKYIDNALKNLKLNPFKDTLKFIDFDVEPGNNGIPGDCILHPDNIEKEAPLCFNIIKDKKYFKQATGWAIKYEARKGSLSAAFRPYVELIGDESMKTQMQQDKDRLEQSIKNFYAGSNYWGD